MGVKKVGTTRRLTPTLTLPHRGPIEGEGIYFVTQSN